MRVCSLVPAATEAMFALGLGECLVGVSHECDWPPEASALPGVTRSALDTEQLGSAEIDSLVAEAARRGRPLYLVDAGAWEQARPDVAVVQEVCDVCAVSTDDVDRVVEATAVDVRVVSYSPRTLRGVPAALEELAEGLGRPGAAGSVGQEMLARLDRVGESVAAADGSPSVFVSEWIDPPYAAGHWLPEMVEQAGGHDVAGRPGGESVRMAWHEVVDLDPDAIVLAPCGFDLERTRQESVAAGLAKTLAATSAARSQRVYLVDANGFFSRPGPRLADGVELLAHLLHPELAADPGLPCERLVA